MKGGKKNNESKKRKKIKVRENYFFTSWINKKVEENKQNSSTR